MFVHRKLYKGFLFNMSQLKRKDKTSIAHNQWRIWPEGSLWQKLLIVPCCLLPPTLEIKWTQISIFFEVFPDSNFPRCPPGHTPVHHYFWVAVTEIIPIARLILRLNIKHDQSFVEKCSLKKLVRVRFLCCGWI